MPKVSVIVPIFNVENYIEKCVHSLFQQTLAKDIEYIFINDCTPDNSVKLLEGLVNSYPPISQNVKIINNGYNLGVAASRQIGVSKSTGEYIIHCDPDDWVEPNMYEAMYDEAIAKEADIVGCDYVEEYPDKQIVKKQNFDDTGENIVANILNGDTHSSLWSRLISRKIINKLDISFSPDITVKEDMLYVVPIHLATKKVVYIPKPYYHYRMVGNSITHTLSLQHVNSALTVMRRLKAYFAGRDDLLGVWEKALCNSAQALITQPDTYYPDRWRKETLTIRSPYFGSLKNRISPWLVRHYYDTLNFFIIKLYRR